MTKLTRVALIVITPYVMFRAWKWVDGQSGAMNDEEYDNHFFDFIMVKEVMLGMGLLLILLGGVMLF
jgi:hypothetical protein